MRRSIFIITVLISFSNYSFCQADSIFNLIPKWMKGEFKRYEIKQYSNIINDNEKKENNILRKEIIIQVIDIKDTLIEMNWKVDKLIFIDTVNSKNPFLGLINSLDKDISVRYLINKKGNIINVCNLDEILTIVKTKIDSHLNDFITKNQIEKSQADLLRLQFSIMYCTKEQVRSIVLRDIDKFHQIYGYSYSINKITIIPDNIFFPNFNGMPSNYLEITLNNFDNNSQLLYFLGYLRCNEQSQKIKNAIEIDRIVAYEFKYKLPGCWLISNKELLNSGNGSFGINNTYEINLIK